MVRIICGSKRIVVYCGQILQAGYIGRYDIFIIGNDNAWVFIKGIIR